MTDGDLIRQLQESENTVQEQWRDIEKMAEERERLEDVIDALLEDAFANTRSRDFWQIAAIAGWSFIFLLAGFWFLFTG